MLPGAFGTLPSDSQALLRSSARTGRWSRGELLFHPDDPADTLHVLTRGAVRLYRLGSGAREVTIDVPGVGDLVGVRALVPGEQYGVYAEAIDDSEALLLGREPLTRLMAAQPAVGVAVTEQVTRQARGAQERLAGLVFLEVSQRLARALLALAEREGEWHDGTLALRERVSHQDLAHMAGSTRETVTKLLGDFRGRGLLDLGYRRIILTDREGLEHLVREPVR